MKKLKSKIRLLMAIHEPPLNQARLAKETGLSPTTINALYLNKFQAISSSTIEVLCNYFQCELSDLLELK
jgi:putative transcriptional regulator